MGIIRLHTRGLSTEFARFTVDAVAPGCALIIRGNGEPRVAVYAAPRTGVFAGNAVWFVSGGDGTLADQLREHFSTSYDDLVRLIQDGSIFSITGPVAVPDGDTETFVDRLDEGCPVGTVLRLDGYQMVHIPTFIVKTSPGTWAETGDAPVDAGVIQEVTAAADRVVAVTWCGVPA